MPTSDVRKSPTSISLPLDADTVRELRSGDSVLLSGPLVTGRDAAHARFAATIEAGEDLPFDPAGETLYVVGPTRPVPATRSAPRGRRPPRGWTPGRRWSSSAGCAE